MSDSLPDLTRARLEEVFDEVEREMFGTSTSQMQDDGYRNEHGAPLSFTVRYDVMEVMARRLVKDGYPVQRVEKAFECWGEDIQSEDEDWRPMWGTDDPLPLLTHTDLSSLYRETSLERFGATVEQHRRDGRFDHRGFPNGYRAHNLTLHYMNMILIERGYDSEYLKRTMERWKSSFPAQTRPDRIALIDLAEKIKAQMRRNGEPIHTSEVIDRLVKYYRRPSDSELSVNRATVLAALRSQGGRIYISWREHIEAERISRLYALFEDLDGKSC